MDLTPDELAADDAQRAIDVGETARREEVDQRRAYADRRKSDYAAELQVNEGDGVIDVLGHQVGLLVDVVRILRAELEASANKEVPLGAQFDETVSRIEEIRQRHPKPAEPSS